ncbi:mini-chromosome maintenance replisome factor-domain-containing protein [Collybia nuda]|uniref:Mini-chromosome maintenance replisome factor-domain-containing protein n=1 Tax=Collybia nuda TaxID=64659 RepID=A0A9P6CBA7_9AGAR|nr:mini-chromosome maintenance replisome factor-domain-containing protein [Collybia nuda]
MVSSFLTDALTDPTLVLHELFQDNHNIDSFPATVSAHFSHIFRSLDAFNEIPVLNVQFPPEAHKDRSLVRFRAMVQDTSTSPEMYMAKQTDSTCGGWGIGDESSTTQDQSHSEIIDYTSLRECTVIWAVTIPGECSWVVNELDSSGPTSTTKKQTTHSPSQPHKFPVPDTPHIGVQVKIYDNFRVAESLRSTELRTFVGILTSELLHGDLETPDPPFVPTLHVLFSQPIPSTLIPRTSKHLERDIRDELITWIAEQGLGGDREAAEWVLLCTLARTQSRSPSILPLSLTLSYFPLPSLSSHSMVNTPSLLFVLSHLLPTLSVLPLSLHTLNTTSFSPESKKENLHSGWLQLPSGSICVVTEGGVTEGGILERGLANLRALQKMITSQVLEYIFPYSRFSFDTEVGFLILSEGRKSTFFQTSVNLPLKLVDTNGKEGLYKSPGEITLPPPEKLDLFRSLIGNAKVGSITIGEKVAEYIRNDFVRERQAMASTMVTGSTAGEMFGSDDLIHRMMVARLLALSLQEVEITVEIWERAKELETTRLTRLA